MEPLQVLRHSPPLKVNLTPKTPTTNIFKSRLIDDIITAHRSEAIAWKVVPLKRLLGLRSDHVATFLGSSTERKVRTEASPLPISSLLTQDITEH